jgi:3-oxoacyl-[acyl-carrier protein] reductase
MTPVGSMTAKASANDQARRDRVLRTLLPLAALVAGIFAWDLVVRIKAIPPYVLPGPLLVAQTLVADWDILWHALVVTLATTFEGLLLALVGGIGIAMLFNQSRLVEYSLYPYAVILQVTPVVAIAPLLLIYLPQQAAVLACDAIEAAGCAALHAGRAENRRRIVAHRRGRGRDRGRFGRRRIGPRLPHRRVGLPAQHPAHVRRADSVVDHRYHDLFRAITPVASAAAALARERRRGRQLTARSQESAMPNKIDLSGRCAVVTGGAQGIGRAIVARFLESGSAVMIWDHDLTLARKTAQELKSRGQISCVACDVRQLADVERARDDTLKAFGRIDILVNNAGIAGPNVKTWEYPPDAWDEVMRINLDGPFFCCRALTPVMITQNYGRIVNVASIAGKEGNPNAPAYSASKAGVIALTKTLGKELATYDIAVNCVTPAAAKTAIFDQMTDEHINYMLSKIPRGRFVTVDEIAALVAFCASADCSFTTGAVFDISGGRATY